MIDHKGTITLETHRLRLRRFTLEDAEDMFNNWGIEIKDTVELIGSIGAVGLNDKNRRCEIGYCMSKVYWNKGIMTEALKYEGNGVFVFRGRHQ